MNTDIKTTIKKGYDYFNEGYFEDAVEAFSDRLNLKPLDSGIYYARGMAYFRLKKWKSAIADFEKARDLDCNDPDNQLGLALSLAMDNKIYEAIRVYDDLLAVNPKLVRAHIQLAMLYYCLGAIAKGHWQLDIALAFRPSLSERERIANLKKEQLLLDKKRYYRPDFEALRG